MIICFLFILTLLKGDIKVSVSFNDAFGTIDATFGYTLSYGKVNTRYIEGGAKSIGPGFMSIEKKSHTITKSVATNGGDKISGHVVYESKIAGAFLGGVNCIRRSTFLVVYFSVTIVTWIISEFLLYKRVKKSEKDDSIWLLLNIVFPYISCLVYLITHRVKVGKGNN